MSTEHSRYTSAAGPSGRTTSYTAGPSSQAGSATSAGPSANAPNHADDQRQFIMFLALAIAKEKKQMPLARTIGAHVGGGTDVVVGKRLPPLQSHAIEWARDWVRVIAALHHAIDKVEKPSLDGIGDDHDPETYQSSSHLFPSSLLCFLVSSQSTISLRLLPPYAPRNETSIFVASYGSCSARSLDQGFPPQRHKIH
jgi:hypothetical protein